MLDMFQRIEGQLAYIQLGFGQRLDFRRRVFEAAYFLDRGDTDIALGRVIPHDVDQVRRRAELLSQSGQLPVRRLVLLSPIFTVLGVEDVVFGIVDDFS